MIVIQLEKICDSKSLPKKYVIPNLYIKNVIPNLYPQKMVVFTISINFFSTDEFQLPRGCLLPAGPPG